MVDGAGMVLYHLFLLLVLGSYVKLVAGPRKPPMEVTHPTAGIDWSNTAGQAVLKQPCLTGDRTGTVRPKPVPAGRTGLSVRFLAGTGHHQPGTDWADPFDRPAQACVGPCLSNHRSNTAVQALLDQPCSTDTRTDSELRNQNRDGLVPLRSRNILGACLQPSVLPWSLTPMRARSQQRPESGRALGTPHDGSKRHRDSWSSWYPCASSLGRT
ncbi:hypothetical protein PCANC_17158 [Puccinia coronata f. sp. avenae]|uniref:Uncharacterized protein n=1 Tax=Puccinia coronata f. sp. avenae TaxID=200324 RepID=A0A2N5UIZ3_9BASI|nr:hypothetical protein PCANC_17158 [Puccinia coronata f. sp. avenae]